MRGGRLLFFPDRPTRLDPARVQTAMNEIIYVQQQHTIGMLFVVTFVVSHDLHVLQQMAVVVFIMRAAARGRGSVIWRFIIAHVCRITIREGCYTVGDSDNPQRRR